MILATLCFVRKGDKTLMLHRNKKEQDMHAGKWVGLGGKFECGESPEDCVVREVKEETNLTLIAFDLKIILTFAGNADGNSWCVFVYVATEFEGDLIEKCPEGDLAWIDTAKLLSLNLWGSDKVFLPLLDRSGVSSAKFTRLSDGTSAYEVVHYTN